MRIAIIGAGGVGGYLGIKLWSAGHDVTFIARGQHLAAMQQRGLKLESPEGTTVAHATFADSLLGQLPVELIIVGVKSYDTPIAIDLARATLKETTTVLSIQNGVENEGLIANALGRKHVLTGVAYIFSTIAEPGIIRHHGGTTKFKIGELDGRLSDRCRTLEGMFKTAGIDVEQVEEIQKLLWEKWIFICGLGGVTAYTRKPIGEILDDSQLHQMLWNVISEAAKVSRSRKISDFVELEERLLVRYHRLPPTHTSSMHYDVTHGKRVEIEALNGAVVRFGDMANIPTPANKQIHDGLKQFA